MKKVCVTYHMELPNETAETCIEIPMIEEVALLVVFGVDSSDDVMRYKAVIARMVEDLAHLQGYIHGTIQDIRYAKEPKEA